PEYVHKYFERKASEWNIVGFLNECEIEPFERKIESYITSLEHIANNEKNRWREVAQSLIDKYKKRVEGQRSHNHIHLRGNINGMTINSGTVRTINGIVSLKRDILDNQVLQQCH
ncbi:3840_t:CDS:2, partial [Cetraspora pellucida]